MITIEVHNAELVSSIAARVKDLGIANGAIVSLIGAVDAFTLSTMPADDARADVLTNYDVPAEMSGSGEIVDGNVHIHATMAVNGDRGISGHLHRAEVGTWFAHVYIIASPNDDSSAEEWWTSEDVAGFLGIQASTVSSYVARKQMPQPDRHIGRMRFWKPSTIIEWHRSRPRHPVTTTEEDAVG